MSDNLKVYSATFDGQYIGGSALIVAQSEGEAAQMLEARLRQAGLWAKAHRHSQVGGVPFRLVEIDLGLARIAAFDDGDY